MRLMLVRSTILLCLFYCHLQRWFRSNRWPPVEGSRLLNLRLFCRSLCWCSMGYTNICRWWGWGLNSISRVYIGPECKFCNFRGKEHTLKWHQVDSWWGSTHSCRPHTSKYHWGSSIHHTPHRPRTYPNPMKQRKSQLILSPLSNSNWRRVWTGWDQ